MRNKKRVARKPIKIEDEEEDYLSDEISYPCSIKRRRRFSVQETNMLEEEYRFNASPSQEKIQQIANQIGTARKIITTWFQNRRAKHKRNEKKEEGEEEGEEEGIKIEGTCPSRDTHCQPFTTDAAVEMNSTYHPSEVSPMYVQYTDPSTMYQLCLNMQNHLDLIPLMEGYAWVQANEEQYVPVPFPMETNDVLLYVNPSQIALNHQL